MVHLILGGEQPGKAPEGPDAGPVVEEQHYITLCVISKAQQRNHEGRPPRIGIGQNMSKYSMLKPFPLA